MNYRIGTIILTRGDGEMLYMSHKGTLVLSPPYLEFNRRMNRWIRIDDLAEAQAEDQAFLDSLPL